MKSFRTHHAGSPGLTSAREARVLLWMLRPAERGGWCGGWGRGCCYPEKQQSISVSQKPGLYPSTGPEPREESAEQTCRDYMEEEPAGAGCRLGRVLHWQGRARDTFWVERGVQTEVRHNRPQATGAG